MRRIAIGFSVLLALIVPAVPASADDNPCSGQAPGPHCRPMDCEIVWDDSLQSDIIPLPGIPTYKCYN
jgi:hypothetical protein